jgi:hypothetical protein
MLVLEIAAGDFEGANITIRSYRLQAVVCADWLRIHPVYIAPSTVLM